MARKQRRTMSSWKRAVLQQLAIRDAATIYNLWRFLQKIRRRFISHLQSSLTWLGSISVKCEKCRRVMPAGSNQGSSYYLQSITQERKWKLPKYVEVTQVCGSYPSVRSYPSDWKTPQEYLSERCVISMLQWKRDEVQSRQ